MSNFYFLMLTLMETIKPIATAGGWQTMAMPLAFVVGVSMIKDIFEDRTRHKSDDEENNRRCNAINRGQSELKQIPAH
jgi:phospholipid-transporting ATPase